MQQPQQNLTAAKPKVTARSKPLRKKPIGMGRNMAKRSKQDNPPKTEQPNENKANNDYTITIKKEDDYDGFFKSFVEEAIKYKIKKGGVLKHRIFIVTAGPFKPYDFHWEHIGNDETVLNLDFYSIVRHHGDFTVADPDLQNIL